jgi:hypothetical protein
VWNLACEKVDKNEENAKRLYLTMLDRCWMLSRSVATQVNIVLFLLTGLCPT